MRTWTDTERLTVVAILLQRKRLESMHLRPVTSINHEGILFWAIATPEACEAATADLEADAEVCWGRFGLEERSVALMALDAIDEPELVRKGLWFQLVGDIRRMFPRQHWPAWLPKFTGQG